MGKEVSVDVHQEEEAQKSNQKELRWTFFSTETFILTFFTPLREQQQNKHEPTKPALHVLIRERCISAVIYFWVLLSVADMW